MSWRSGRQQGLFFALQYISKELRNITNSSTEQQNDYTSHLRPTKGCCEKYLRKGVSSFKVLDSKTVLHHSPIADIVPPKLIETHAPLSFYLSLKSILLIIVKYSQKIIIAAMLSGFKKDKQNWPLVDGGCHAWSQRLLGTKITRKFESRKGNDLCFKITFDLRLIQ